jgi:hypothetical protein
MRVLPRLKIRLDQHTHGYHAPFTLFEHYHPTRLHEIDDLRPVPTRPILSQIKEWWKGVSNSMSAPSSSVADDDDNVTEV